MRADSPPNAAGVLAGVVVAVLGGRRQPRQRISMLRAVIDSSERCRSRDWTKRSTKAGPWRAGRQRGPA